MFSSFHYITGDDRLTTYAGKRNWGIISLFSPVTFKNNIFQTKKFPINWHTFCWYVVRSGYFSLSPKWEHISRYSLPFPGGDISRYVQFLRLNFASWVTVFQTSIDLNGTSSLLCRFLMLTRLQKHFGRQLKSPVIMALS